MKSSKGRDEDFLLTSRRGKKPKSSYVHGRFANQSSCLFSLPGIWPDGADGTDVNSVDRSKGKQLVATGDDFGNVNLYRYPCVSEKVRITFILKVRNTFILLCNVIFLLCSSSNRLIVACWLDGKTIQTAKFYRLVLI